MTLVRVSATRLVMTFLTLFSVFGGGVLLSATPSRAFNQADYEKFKTADSLSPRVSFDGADLSNADLGRGGMMRFNLSGANLSGANLSGKTMKLNNFINANLSGANLSNVTLIEQNFDNTNFTNANLRGVKTLSPTSRFISCDFSGADLSTMDFSNFFCLSCIYSSSTKFPPGFSPKARGFIPQSDAPPKVQAPEGY